MRAELGSDVEGGQDSLDGFRDTPNIWQSDNRLVFFIWLRLRSVVGYCSAVLTPSSLVEDGVRKDGFPEPFN